VASFDLVVAGLIPEMPRDRPATDRVTDLAADRAVDRRAGNPGNNSSAATGEKQHDLQLWYWMPGN
jgi:hypothetical protein